MEGGLGLIVHIPHAITSELPVTCWQCPVKELVLTLAPYKFRLQAISLYFSLFTLSNVRGDDDKVFREQSISLIVQRCNCSCVLCTNSAHEQTVSDFAFPVKPKAPRAQNPNTPREQSAAISRRRNSPHHMSTTRSAVFSKAKCEGRQAIGTGNALAVAVQSNQVYRSRRDAFFGWHRAPMRKREMNSEKNLVSSASQTNPELTSRGMGGEPQWDRR